MALFQLFYFIWVLFSVSYFVLLTSASCYPYQFVRQSNRQFEQKTDRFWEFREQADNWVEVHLPYDLVSCVNSDCRKVDTIIQTANNAQARVDQQYEVPEQQTSLRKDANVELEGTSDVILPNRKRISLTKMSDTSIWVTGESGSIYERFWNGLQWVLAPHDLPTSEGHGISVFIINQTILALSEAGSLYQVRMQLSENSQPVWVQFTVALTQNTERETEQIPVIFIKSGVVSHDRLRAYFCTKNGTLLELSEVVPPRWVNCGHPAGANVAAIADASSNRVVYTISSAGDLYEYDRNSKPSWKKHIWREETTQTAPLIPSMACALHGLSADHSISLFLLTKAGTLVERRLQQRKWKWVVHGSPKDYYLTSITPVQQDESRENLISLFFTTSTGSILEYEIPKLSGTVQENQYPEGWESHLHPLHAKVARGIRGLQLQIGRILFPLDDGRLAELHLPGLGGENSGPVLPLNFRRKASSKYVWSILDAPESEGWNAEYCKEARGPTNCITGIKDESDDSGVTRSVTRRRKGTQTQFDYLPPGTSGSGQIRSSEEYHLPDNWININFRLRLMHEGKSFFLITDGGLTFEFVYTQNMWLWLRHESSTAMKGILGNYNGSLFLVDLYGSLLIRERSANELAWMNCTGMKKGRHVIGGPPWDGLPGIHRKVRIEDALFFVSKNGRLLQFTVSMRKFKWKDCRSPSSTKIACIVDQELFRENLVFVLGRNGRLYQYNKMTNLWHEHQQSQHLILSHFPGTAMRQSSISLSGSLFMLSEEGGLVEYHWNTWDGWNWIEHGTPYIGVTLVGSPGPCIKDNQLFLIGSDGKVYLRYMDKKAWKWKNCGFPSMGNRLVKNNKQVGIEVGGEEVCVDEDFASGLENDPDNQNDLNKKCDPKVAYTRPIPFSEDSVVFELRDGRLAEMQWIQGTEWVWSRIIGTPTSLCSANYWTAMAS
ncbi:Large neutral amino acids transporter small subunit like [Quillaja saponaria]|uniref:Large neutral amino acids transporter small subunit like n=1 Tax=Quillaja saponaria TaxID=32244 RepID=A0AAD7PRD2_QUISA|nr:Large neutral amino acids transporter small subunit like [Quillaja saponaria]